MANERIEGLFIDVPVDELRKALGDRADYHAGRANVYDTKLKAIREKTAEVSALLDDGEGSPMLRKAWENGSYATGHQQSPEEAMAASRRHHQARAGYFAFMVKYLVKESVYRLSEQDLTRLELISQNL